MTENVIYLKDNFKNINSDWIEELKKIAEKSNSWPFVEARNLRDRLEKSGIDNQKTVLFETGYGPSGLPHIGTFGEVARTTIVRNAFEVLTDRKTKLICFFFPA